MTPTESFHTVADFVRWATSQFNAEGLHFGHGTDNAFDEAVWLVLHALHLPSDFPSHLWHTQLLSKEKQAVYSLLQQRIEQRIPAAYLTGEAWFANLKFQVNPAVLIPRSPIAELIEQGFAPWLEPDSITDVLDLCTGSGCIGIATAMHLPQASVTLSDISTEALTVASSNAAAYLLDERLKLLQSDLFDNLVPQQQFDLIVSNPPYVDQQELDWMPAEYQHEPRLGLEAGEDGLQYVRRILNQARQYLKPHGVLIVEVGASQAALEETYPHLPFTWLSFAHGGQGVFLLTAGQLPQVENGG